MRLFLKEHDIVIECCLFTLTRWQPLIAKDQEKINGSCLNIRFFSVCENKSLLFTRCQALQCHYLLNGLNHRGSTYAMIFSEFFLKAKHPIIKTFSYILNLCRLI